MGEVIRATREVRMGIIQPPPTESTLFRSNLKFSPATTFYTTDLTLVPKPPEPRLNSKPLSEFTIILEAKNKSTTSDQRLDFDFNKDEDNIISDNERKTIVTLVSFLPLDFLEKLKDRPGLLILTDKANPHVEIPVGNMRAFQFTQGKTANQINKIQINTENIQTIFNQNTLACLCIVQSSLIQSNRES